MIFAVNSKRKGNKMAKKKCACKKKGKKKSGY